jgi:hypothetical protein
MKGYNTKNKKEIMYPSVRLAILPVFHGPEIPVLSRPGNLICFHLYQNLTSLEVKRMTVAFSQKPLLRNPIFYAE